MKSYFLIILSLLFCAQLYAQTPQIVVTTGHSKVITALAVAPNGKYIASTSANHLIKIWEVNSGKEITTINNKLPDSKSEERVQSIEFTADGKYLISSDENAKINVWDLITEKPVHSFLAGHGMPYLTMDVLGDEMVYFNSNYHITEFNLSTKKEVIHDNVYVKLVKINPAKPRELFVVTVDNQFRLYNMDSKTFVKDLEASDVAVLRVEISRDGKFLVALFNFNEIRVWDLKTGKIVHKINQLGLIMHLKFHQKTDELVILHQSPNNPMNKEISIMNLKKQKINRKLSNISIFSTIFDLSGDGKFMAINSSEYRNRQYSYTIELKNWKNGETVKNLYSRASAIQQIEASQQFPYVASLCSDMNLRIWNMELQQIDWVMPYVQKIAINQQGNHLALAGINLEGSKLPALLVWDFEQKKYIAEIPMNYGVISSMQFSGDGSKIAVVEMSAHVSIFDLKSQKLVHKFIPPQLGYQQIALSNDFEYIAISALGLGGVKVKNLQTEEIISITDVHPLLGASDLFFTSDDKYLVTGSFDNSVCLIQTNDWTIDTCFTENIGPISSVCQDSKGERIASSSRGSSVEQSDYAVHAWNIQTQNHLCKLLGHIENVQAVSFYGNKNILYSGSDDGMLKIWDLDHCTEIASCIAIDLEDYIFVTPDNYYSGSKDALSGIGFKINGTKLYPFEQFDLRLNRPDIIAKRIGMASQELQDAFYRAYQKRLKKMGFNENSFNQDYNLPSIKITNRHDIEFASAAQKITLEIEASDSKYLLDRILVWINDVPIYGQQGLTKKNAKATQLKDKITVELSEGENRIELSVMNEKGVESLKEMIFVISTDSERKQSLYLYAIGVSDYVNDAYDLKYAAKDAKDLAKLIQESKTEFDEVNVIQILDKDATRENILALKKEMANTKVNDLVIFFVAAHGMFDSEYDYYIATTDIDANNPSDKGLLFHDLEQMLDGIPARKKVIFVDACHSGEFDAEDYYVNKQALSKNVNARAITVSTTSKKTLGTDNSFRLMKELFADLRRGSGAIIISSAGAAEYAYESDKVKNGVFTYVLLKSLRENTADLNRDKQIVISELQQYVQQRVSKLTRGLQTPTTRRENIHYDFRIW